MRYDLNLEQIEQQLTYLQRCRSILLDVEKGEESEIIFFALSRALHLAVECMIDIGTVMIDGFIMRDPGGYIDIIDILEDEQVLTSDVAMTVRKWVQIRDQLVRHYTKVDWEDCLLYQKQHEVLERFELQVRSYIQREG